MKLSELKVGDKFRFRNNAEAIYECASPPRLRNNGKPEVSIWSDVGGFYGALTELDVIPIPEYKVGDWVQCDSVDGVAERHREFMRVGRKYRVDSLLEDNWKWLAQMRNTEGICDAVYYMLDHFSPAEEPKPQYKPYSDLRVLVGKVLKTKDGSTDFMLFRCGETSAWIGPGTSASANFVLNNYTYLDGTPCGELVIE